MGAQLEPFALLYQKEFDSICPELTPAQMVVYTALVTCRNARTGKTIPVGVDLIVTKTALKRRTVFDALKALTQKGFIGKDKQGRKAIYSFPYFEKCTQPH